MKTEPKIMNEVTETVELIKPLLANKEPQLQGAIIAELMAIWLAGHRVRGNPEETEHLRDSLLAAHCAFVRQLTNLYAENLGKNE